MYNAYPFGFKNATIHKPCRAFEGTHENNKEKRLDHLLKSIDFQNRIIDSHNFDDNTKTTFFNYSNQLKEVIQGKLTRHKSNRFQRSF